MAVWQYRENDGGAAVIEMATAMAPVIAMEMIDTAVLLRE